MENQNLKRRVRAAAFLFVAAAFALLHADVLFGDKVYLNRWTFRNHAPFAPAPESALNPLNQNSDQVTHFFSAKYFMADSLRSGALPLWNPRAFSGFPLYANGSSAVFSPFNLLLLRRDPFTAYKAVFPALFLAGAALFFVYLSRYLGLSALASAAGAMALIFCPLLIEHIDFDTLLMFVWMFPAVLLVCEKWKRDPAFPGVPALAAVLFAGALTAHIHTSLNALLLALAYRTVLFRGAETARQSLGRFAASAALFLGLSSFIWAPTAAFFIRSQFVSVAPPPGALSWPLTPLTAVFPVFSKLPGVGQALGALPVPLSQALDSGLVPGLLGLAGLTFAFRGGVDRRVRLFAVFAVAYHLSIFLPGTLFLPGVAGSLANVLSMKLWQIHVLAVAALTAYGFDAVFHDCQFNRSLRRLLAGLTTVVVVPAAVFFAVLAFFPGILLRAASALPLSGPAGDPARFAEGFERLRAVVSEAWPAIWLPALTAPALFWLVRTARIPEKTGRRRALLFIALAANLFVMARLWRPVPAEAKDVFPATGVTDFLRNQPGIFRILTLQSGRTEGEAAQKYVLKPNLPSVYGLEDVGGQESLLNGRYSYFAQKYLGDQPDKQVTAGGIVGFERVNLNAAGFMNVRYLIASDKRPSEGLREAFRGDGAVVYENPRELPRFFFTRRVRPFESEDAAFRLLTGEAVGGEPEISVEALSLSASPAPPAKVGVERRPAGAFVARFSPDEEGVLVFSESFDPGWRASENGRPLDVFRVSGLVCGVRVQPGTHEILFEYRPKLLQICWIVSAFFALLTAYFFFLQGRKRRV